MPEPKKEKVKTYSRLLEEVSQELAIRRPLYLKLEELLGGNKKVVAFFTSFRYPVIIEDEDAHMLEEVLQNTDLDGKELVLLISSPGGDALAAERIVNICRSFSSDKFSVIVPKMAKSAATMVCFGAHEIRMSKTSELGPIDPQISVEDERGNIIKYQAAHEILESYNELMRKANTTNGNMEPYLQQLARFDARDIRRIVYAQALSESIAVKCLQSGILSGRNYRYVKSKIKPFLDPQFTKTHGRPIYHDVALSCGLPIRLTDLQDQLWQTVWSLYVRLTWVVNNQVAKMIESSENSFSANVPPFLLGEHQMDAGGVKP
jgi:hypothetical protein